MGKKSRRNKPAKVRIPFVNRPFEGLPFEAELVAMREILPSATLKLVTTADHGSEELLMVTMLPGMVPGMRRTDGQALVAAQSVMSSGDASLDLADRILKTLALKPGQTLPQAEQPQPGARLQDILDLSASGEFELHDNYDYWADSETAADMRDALQQAADQILPTQQVPGIDGAFWVRMQREFLRWVRTEDEDAVLDGLARLQQRRELTFDGARFVGAFRALGLLIPVFELEPGTEAEELTGPLTDFEPKLTAAITSADPLTPEERSARAGIISRQVTLR